MLENRWVRCPRCGHKLFKDNSRADVEIKCSSCKAIVTVVGGVTVRYVEQEVKKEELKEERND